MKSSDGGLGGAEFVEPGDVPSPLSIQPRQDTTLIATETFCRRDPCPSHSISSALVCAYLTFWVYYQLHQGQFGDEVKRMVKMPPVKDPRSRTIALLFSLLLLFLCVAPGKTIAQILQLDFNFRHGTVGWTADFASYPPATNGGGIYQLATGPRYAPRKLTRVPIRTFLVQGNNLSGELIMFLKRRLTASDGIVAGRAYRIEYVMTLASNAATGCVGIGAPPGEGVFLRAGASPFEPIPRLRIDGYLELNINLATATTAAGDIANGLDCETVYPFFPYVYIERPVQHISNVTATAEGELWLFVGTASLFEGLTRLYYQRINVRLVPV